MGKSTNYANILLKALFQNVADSNNIFGNSGGTTPSGQAGTLGTLYISLHTADPGASGTQSTNEANYTGYARQALTRNNTNFSVSGNSVSLGATLNFPACTGGSNTITHFGIGTASTGNGFLIISGTVTPNISVSTGVTPQLTTSGTITES